MRVDTNAVAHAVDYAAEAHAGHLRKGADVPYLAHLLSVTALVLEHGCSTAQAQAAVLHDVVEDCGGAERLADVRETFGDEVAAMVEALSDAAPAVGEDKAPWQPRKEAYLTKLRELASDGHPAVLVSACDKLHNARSIVADATDPEGHPGLAVFDRFSATPTQTAWYYQRLVEIFASSDLPARLRAELAATVRDLAELASQADGAQDHGETER